METMKLDKFSCDEVRAMKDKWLKDFKEKNACESTDMAYDNYRREIQEFIDNCKCKKSFGNDESQNIQIAKDKRKCGLSWNKQRKNDEKETSCT